MSTCLHPDRIKYLNFDSSSIYVVYSQINYTIHITLHTICYNNVISWIIFIPFEMLYYNTQLYHVSLSLLNTICSIWRCFLCLSTLLPCCQPSRWFGLHFIVFFLWKWTRSKQINVRNYSIPRLIIQWTTMRR